MANVNITTNGIRKILKNYNSALAVAEYIWNSFDAKAKQVEMNFQSNALGQLEYLEISDNGTGINFDQLKSKFDPFYDSEKVIEISAPKHTSVMHGKNGVGRLTFFNFAYHAEWMTTFNNSELASANIKIKADSLNTYEAALLPKPIDSKTGTNVRFTNVQLSTEDIEKTISPFLITEFCWFLELNKAKNYQISINGNLLDYSSNIVEQEDFEVEYEKTKIKFSCRFIQWRNSLHKEFSKYYFVNEKGEEIYKDYTTLNKKGDDFFHSLFIRSDFFNDFDFRSSETDTQENLFNKAKTSPEYKFLIKTVNEYLRNKRKPFLRVYASRLVESYEQDGIFPEFNNEWEKLYKKPQLEETLISLYEVNPKLFSGLNIDQKKTFVRFLNLLLDTNEKDQLFAILDEIVDLDTKEREDFAKLFKVTKLDRIIQTIKLLEDRYSTFYKLKDLVFNESIGADEVSHLQKVIENHYWIFGEQYHLVTAAEPKFNEALRRYIHHLTEKDEVIDINHPDKNREMDIFACRQNFYTDRIDNIVVELKHPLINLGANQFNQVHKYLDVISKQPEFNAPNMFWEFHLVGNRFDTTNYIKNLISSMKVHGQKSLALSIEDGRIKVFVKTWSEVFAEFEMRHKHLNDKLALERDLLLNELQTADEIVDATRDNLAVQPGEITVKVKEQVS